MYSEPTETYQESGLKSYCQMRFTVAPNVMINDDCLLARCNVAFEGKGVKATKNS